MYALDDSIPQLNLFVPFAKIDKETRLVTGIVTDEALDTDGQVISYEAAKKAMPGYMEWANVRMAHDEHQYAGIMKSLTPDDASRSIHAVAYIQDDNAWDKVRTGVCKGFSIGGNEVTTEMQKMAGHNVPVITKFTWIETSVVDRPANPHARLTISKMAFKAAAEAEGDEVMSNETIASEEAVVPTTVAKAEKTPKDAKAETPPTPQDEPVVAPTDEPVAKPEDEPVAKPQDESVEDDTIAKAGWLPEGVTQGDLDDGDFAWLSDAYKAGNEPSTEGRKLPYKIHGVVNGSGWRAAWSRAHQSSTTFVGGPNQEAVIAKLQADQPKGVKTAEDKGKKKITKSAEETTVEAVVEKVAEVDEPIADVTVTPDQIVEKAADGDTIEKFNDNRDDKGQFAPSDNGGSKSEPAHDEKGQFASDEKETKTEEPTYTKENPYGEKAKMAPDAPSGVRGLSNSEMADAWEGLHASTSPMLDAAYGRTGSVMQDSGARPAKIGKSEDVEEEAKVEESETIAKSAADDVKTLEQAIAGLTSFIAAESADDSPDVEDIDKAKQALAIIQGLSGDEAAEDETPAKDGDDTVEAAPDKVEKKAEKKDEKPVEKTETSAVEETAKCDTCEGSGKIKEGHVKCPDCDGSGKATDQVVEKAVDVTTDEKVADETIVEKAVEGDTIEKYNESHDENGRFSSGDSAGGSSAAADQPLKAGEKYNGHNVGDEPGQMKVGTTRAQVDAADAEVKSQMAPKAASEPNVAKATQAFNDKFGKFGDALTAANVVASNQVEKEGHPPMYSDKDRAAVVAAFNAKAVGTAYDPNTPEGRTTIRDASLAAHEVAAAYNRTGAQFSPEGEAANLNATILGAVDNKANATPTSPGYGPRGKETGRTYDSTLQRWFSRDNIPETREESLALEPRSSASSLGKTAEGETMEKADNAKAAEDCATCEGKGTIKEGHVKCPDCGGSGQAPADTIEKADAPVDETADTTTTVAKPDETLEKGTALEDVRSLNRSIEELIEFIESEAAEDEPDTEDINKAKEALLILTGLAGEEAQEAGTPADQAEVAAEEDDDDEEDEDDMGTDLDELPETGGVPDLGPNGGALPAGVGLPDVDDNIAMAYSLVGAHMVQRAATLNKAGRRNSAADQTRIQQLHDLSLSNGAKCPDCTCDKCAGERAANASLDAMKSALATKGAKVSKSAGSEANTLEEVIGNLNDFITAETSEGGANGDDIDKAKQALAILSELVGEEESEDEPTAPNTDEPTPTPTPVAAAVAASKKKVTKTATPDEETEEAEVAEPEPIMTPAAVEEIAKAAAAGALADQAKTVIELVSEMLTQHEITKSAQADRTVGEQIAGLRAEVERIGRLPAAGGAFIVDGSRLLRAQDAQGQISKAGVLGQVAAGITDDPKLRDKVGQLASQEAAKEIMKNRS